MRTFVASKSVATRRTIFDEDRGAEEILVARERKMVTITEDTAKFIKIGYLI